MQQRQSRRGQPPIDSHYIPSECTNVVAARHTEQSMGGFIRALDHFIPTQNNNSYLLLHKTHLSDTGQSGKHKHPHPHAHPNPLWWRNKTFRLGEAGFMSSGILGLERKLWSRKISPGPPSNVVTLWTSSKHASVKCPP